MVAAILGFQLKHWFYSLNNWLLEITLHIWLTCLSVQQNSIVPLVHQVQHYDVDVSRIIWHCVESQSSIDAFRLRREELHSQWSLVLDNPKGWMDRLHNMQCHQWALDKGVHPCQPLRHLYHGTGTSAHHLLCIQVSDTKIHHHHLTHCW